VLLCVGVLLLHLVQAYFWQYDAQTADCGVRQEVAVHGIRSVWTVWSWVTELLVFGLVPLAMLALNALVIAETRRMAVIEHQLLPTSSSGISSCRPRAAAPAPADLEKQRHQLLPTSSSGGGTRGSGSAGKSRGASKPSATTVMLLAVSFYLIAMTLPVTVVYAVYYSFPEGDATADVATDATWHDHLTYWTIRTVVQEIGMSHYAGNIFIYVATGKIFRSELSRLSAARCRSSAKTGGSPMYCRHTPSVDADANGRMMVTSKI